MNDPLDRYLDAFGTRLHTATAPAPRRARRPLLLAAPALAGALTAILLLLPSGSTTRRLDVVAEARAALATPADVLTHLIVRQHVEDSSIPALTTEQWSATRPARWRVSYVMPTSSTNHPGERVEVAYADGVEDEYYPARNHLRRIAGVPVHGAPASSPIGNDPVATLRDLLARHRLRDAGTTKVGDREVRRLVGVRTRHFGDRRVDQRVEYDVDPDTFAPVRARIEDPAPHDRGRPAFVAILDFQRFERLPLDATTTPLLKVHPRPGVTITRID